MAKSTAIKIARSQFRGLENWLYSDRTRNLGLQSIEVGEETRGRELLRSLLQAHINGRGPGDVGPAILIFQANHGEQRRLYRQKGLRRRSILTIFGKVSVERVRYASRRGACIHPLDQQFQLPARCYSYELQGRLTKRAIQGPFDEAIEAVEEATGVKLPKKSAESIVIDACVDFESFYELRKGKSPEGSGSVLVGSIDCKGIPMVKTESALKTVRRGKGQKSNKKKMATVAAVFTQRPRPRTPEDVVKSLFDPSEEKPRKKRKSTNDPERKRVWASLLSGKDAFIQDVKKEMDRRDPSHEKTRVVVTDGERALQRLVCKTMKNVLYVLDFLHVLEKLWAVAYVFHPEGSQQAKDFVRERALRILQGNVGQVVKGLRQIVTKRKLKGRKRDTIMSVTAYYYRNRLRMRYHKYLAAGLPIASGSVEGACKNLIKDRMERSGMRWSLEMAEAMVKMRAIYLSDDFAEYWDYHVNQEQRRLYSDKRWRALKHVVSK